MKNLLNYQSTEYDCGPVTVTNALRYLFHREEIYPDMIKYIMLYCLDAYNKEGEPCKHGTSKTAMLFLTNWLNHFGQIKDFPVSCEFLSGEEVTLTESSRIVDGLKKGGVVVLRLFLDIGHYVLLTGVEGENIRLFDPYYEDPEDPMLDSEYKEAGISFITDEPKSANRLISMERLNRITQGYYEMGPYETREAMLMFNSTIKQ